MDLEQLKASSQRWMAAALTAFAQGPDTYDFAVHHAGIAVEHLLKAYLVSLHPALIVDGRDFDSLLHATGHGAHASKPATRARTIGLMDAHTRVHAVLRARIPIDKRALEPVAEARNGVAHSGTHDAADVQTVFTTCLRLIDPLLTELQIDPATYWGRYTRLHDRLIEERAKATRIQLEGKLAKARATFEQRYEHLSPKERELVLTSATRRPTSYMEREEERACPVCASTGWLIGDTYVDRTNGAVVVFVPYIFQCTACDLEIENEEFWEMGDLGDEVILDDPPEDVYADWEPDEDFYSGR